MGGRLLLELNKASNYKSLSSRGYNMIYNFLWFSLSSSNIHKISLCNPKKGLYLLIFLKFDRFFWEFIIIKMRIFKNSIWQHWWVVSQNESYFRVFSLAISTVCVFKQSTYIFVAIWEKVHNVGVQNFPVQLKIKIF